MTEFSKYGYKSSHCNLTYGWEVGDVGVEVGDGKDNPTRGRTKRTRPATIVPVFRPVRL